MNACLLKAANCESDYVLANLFRNRLLSSVYQGPWRVPPDGVMIKIWVMTSLTVGLPPSSVHAIATRSKARLDSDNSRHAVEDEHTGAGKTAAASGRGQNRSS